MARNKAPATPINRLQTPHRPPAHAPPQKPLFLCHTASPYQPSPLFDRCEREVPSADRANAKEHPKLPPVPAERKMTAYR